MALTDLDTVKSFAGIAEKETTWDSIIETLITETSADIATRCGQPIEQTEVQWEFRGRGSRDKIIEYFPVADLSEVRMFQALDWTVISDTEYALISPNGIWKIRRQSTFYDGHLYDATFKVGYAEDAIPPEIQKVAREMVLYALKQLDIKQLGGKEFLGVKSVAEMGPAGSAVKTSPKSQSEMDAEWNNRLQSYTRSGF